MHHSLAASLQEIWRWFPPDCHPQVSLRISADHVAFVVRSCLSREIPLMPSFCETGIYRGSLPRAALCRPAKASLSSERLHGSHALLLEQDIAAANMDITIQHPWFKRALGPLIPSRLFDQFFGEGLLEYDLLPLFSSTISPYYRQSLFRSVLESGISEVRLLTAPSFAFLSFSTLCWLLSAQCFLEWAEALALCWGRQTQPGLPYPASCPFWEPRSLAWEKAALQAMKKLSDSLPFITSCARLPVLPSQLSAVW